MILLANCFFSLLYINNYLPMYYLIATAFCVVLMTIGLWSKWAAMAHPEKENDRTSMIEQLVPEIRTHILSYLDYASLCRLSMTNSFMRKAANDDYAWKALYHKDFWVEQDDAVRNDWKGYYAVTRTIVNLSAKFHNIIGERNLSLMREMWLNADYVKCIQSPCHFNSGYDAVMETFERWFRYAVENNIQYREVEKREFRARVMKEAAWVVEKIYKQGDPQPYRDSNVFEYHNGRWYMVLHQSSIDDDIYE